MVKEDSLAATVPSRGMGRKEVSIDKSISFFRLLVNRGKKIGP
jgi:hypothetical protein